MQRLIPVACVLLLGACAFASKVEILDSTLLRKSCADPWLFRHEGKFYLTQTGSAKVRVLESDTLTGLAAADCAQSIAYDSAGDPTVKSLGYAGVSGTWSPEIHCFTDADFPGHAGWYMFLALRDAATGDARHVKSVVLKSLSGKPAGPYGHLVTGCKRSFREGHVELLLHRISLRINLIILILVAMRLPVVLHRVLVAGNQGCRHQA